MCGSRSVRLVFYFVWGRYCFCVWGGNLCKSGRDVVLFGVILRCSLVVCFGFCVVLVVVLSGVCFGKEETVGTFVFGFVD